MYPVNLLIKIFACKANRIIDCLIIEKKKKMREKYFSLEWQALSDVYFFPLNAFFLCNMKGKIGKRL